MAFCARAAAQHVEHGHHARAATTIYMYTRMPLFKCGKARTYISRAPGTRKSRFISGTTWKMIYKSHSNVRPRKRLNARGVQGETRTIARTYVHTKS